MSTDTPELPPEAPVGVNYLSLLVVDDERAIRDICMEVGESMGFRVYSAENSTTAVEQLERHTIDVIILDIKLPGVDGLELLLRIKQHHPDTEVIMITGHPSVDSVLAAMKNGAYDYLRKPFDVDGLKVLLERVAEHLRFSSETRSGRDSFKGNPGYGGMIGRSPEMEKLYRIVTKVASSRHPVLIQGESGSGKEMVARAVHFTGPFRDKPFIAVDCGSLAPTLLESELFGYVKGAFRGADRPKEGLFLLASGGTIFLDKITEMPTDSQAKLLRALQEREVFPLGGARPVAIDVRIIAGAQRDLEIATHQGSFRRDLYSRLNVVSLRLPPLRERKEDIGYLVDYFLERISRSKGLRQSISPDAVKQLHAYDWPGNVRELENCLERASTLCAGPVLNVADLPSQIQNANLQVIPISTAGGKAAIVPLAELEKEAIIAALHQLQGDKVTAARLLGIGKTTLYRKLKEYGIVDRWDAVISEDADAAEDDASAAQAG